MTIETPACRECGHRDHWLGEHIIEAHLMSLPDYLKRYPGAPLASKAAQNELNRGTADLRKHQQKPPEVTSLSIDFAGVRAKVNFDVPESACLKLPDAYRIPQYGELAKDVREAAVSLARGRSMYVWGLPGTGKDALFHAFSWMSRTPGLIFQVEPSADIRAWFFSHEFNKDGTYWAEGELLKALRDGYTTPSGRKVPYIILITDFDRATKEQAESLRLVLDSIEGRVKGPAGVTYKVFPGTQVVVTANTAGGGDSRGRMISANVIDASILDRFGRAYEFHWMDWQDEEVIVRDKFPLLVERCPAVFGQIGAATGALRKAIASDELYAEFSHRALCAWLGHAEDIVAVEDKVPADLVKRAFRAVLDKLPDAETRDAAIHLASPHISGGALPKAGKK